MSGPALVVTDHAFGGTAHEQAAADALGRELIVHQVAADDEPGARAAVAGADVVFVNFAPMTAAVLEALGSGAVVIRYGVGYDNVDLDAARRLGVRVCNVPDYGVDTVADHAVSCLLALLRRTGPYTAAIVADGWVTPGGLGPLRDFRDTTVGLIGTGRIGLSVAARLAPFGFRVIAFDPYADPIRLASHGITAVSLEELLAQAHAVSLHAPLTDATRRIIGGENLARMRSDAVLVNTARGGLVDQEAVAEALLAGRLGGAALDVFDPEPLPPASRLREAGNVILTPHAAFFSDRSLDNLQRLAAEEALRAVRGEPLRCPVG
ncbi:C-terminal binding protein [Microbacterium stercoris]|uniref:C-terminal binding protein n=1 Tax=Microbacterium stercoris TaxID=2820289 RepID=A0A939TPM7_9MICO|nr:C-terminal binding protein [Microbacterium stercoris]MBO3662565.1 C-terminal binding protein [Microbacterium stercoris]